MRRLAVILGVSVVLAACGGNGAPGAAKARYISQGDVICRQVISTVSSIGSATDTPTLEKVQDAWNQAFQQIDTLPVPQEGEAKVLEFKAGLRNVRLTSGDAVQASMVGDQARVQRSVQAESTARTATAKAAKDYGFKVCSQL